MTQKKKKELSYWPTKRKEKKREISSRRRKNTKSKRNNSAGWTLLPLLLLLLLLFSCCCCWLRVRCYLWQFHCLVCSLPFLFPPLPLLMLMHYTQTHTVTHKNCARIGGGCFCVAYFYVHGVIKRFPRCYAYWYPIELPETG